MLNIVKKQPEELQREIEILPNKIFKVSLETIKLEEEYELKKAEYELEMNFYISDPEIKVSNATEKKALAIVKTSGKKDEVIKLLMELKRKEANLIALRNQFDAFRKSLGYETAIAHSQHF